MVDRQKDGDRTRHLDDYGTICARDRGWRKGRVLSAKVTATQRPAMDRALLVEALSWLVANRFISISVRCRAVHNAAIALGRKEVREVVEPQLSNALLDSTGDTL